MLTFERLVHETARKLISTNSEMDENVVREVLMDAGIDDSLRDAGLSPHGRLLIHNVHIIGEKERPTDNETPKAFNYYRELGTGLWAWIGKNGSGKSTILNCILWALTGS